MKQPIQTIIPINSISLDQQHFCLTCHRQSAYGSSFSFSSISPSDYVKLQENGWKRVGQKFYHSSMKSCCQQQIEKVPTDTQFSDKNIRKTLRTFQSVQLDQQTLYEYIQRKNPLYLNQLKYVDLTKFNGKRIEAVLLSKKAFEDFLKAAASKFQLEGALFRMSNRSKSNLQSRCFKDSHNVEMDFLQHVIENLNNEMMMNIRLDHNGIVHFKWNKEFKKLVQEYLKFKQLNPQETIRMEQSSQQFDEETFHLYQKFCSQILNTEICESMYKKLINETQNSTVFKYYNYNNELIAVSVVDILNKSLHRICAFYDPQYQKQSIGKLIKYLELKKAKQLNLDNYYFVKFVKKQNDQLFQQDKSGQIPLPIEQITVWYGNKQAQIKQLQPNYKSYIIGIFKQLTPIFGRQLIENIIFKYI